MSGAQSTKFCNLKIVCAKNTWANCNRFEHFRTTTEFFDKTMTRTAKKGKTYVGFGVESVWFNWKTFKLYCLLWGWISSNTDIFAFQTIFSFHSTEPKLQRPIVKLSSEHCSTFDREWHCWNLKNAAFESSIPFHFDKCDCVHMFFHLSLQLVPMVRHFQFTDLRACNRIRITVHIECCHCSTSNTVRVFDWKFSYIDIACNTPLRL